MLTSPFNPGAGTAPPVLAGRDDLLADAEELLTRAAHFGRAASPLVWTGVRGVGKTVALLEARKRAEERGFAVAHVTADPAGGLPGRVAEGLAGALVAAGVTRGGSGWERLVERLSAFNVQLSLGGVVTISTDVDATAMPARTSQDMFRSLVADAAVQISEAGRAGLLITLDELQEAPLDELILDSPFPTHLALADARLPSGRYRALLAGSHLMDGPRSGPSGSFTTTFAARRSLRI